MLRDILALLVRCVLVFLAAVAAGVILGGAFALSASAGDRLARSELVMRLAWWIAYIVDRITGALW